MIDMIIQELIAHYPSLEVCKSSIEKLATAMTSTFRAGGKLLVCGNGGSASDSLHIVGELMKSFRLPRPLAPEYTESLRALGDEGKYLITTLDGALPAIALVGSSALVTAVCNDRTSDTIFAQQVTGLGKSGDMLLALTSSGNSRNCVLAAVAAKARGMTVGALTGEGGGEIAQLADITASVPERETYLVQELHLPIYHALCAYVENKFFGE